MVRGEERGWRGGEKAWHDAWEWLAVIHDCPCLLIGKQDRACLLLWAVLSQWKNSRCDGCVYGDPNKQPVRESVIINCTRRCKCDRQAGKSGRASDRWKNIHQVDQVGRFHHIQLGLLLCLRMGTNGNNLWCWWGRRQRADPIMSSAGDKLGEQVDDTDPWPLAGIWQQHSGLNPNWTSG